MARSVRKLMQAVRNEPTLTVDDAAVLLSLSRHSAYGGVKAGQIPSIRIGRRVLVPCAGLRAMLGIERPEPPEETGRRQDQPDMAKVLASDAAAKSRKPPVRKAAAPRKPVKSQSVAAE